MISDDLGLSEEFLADECVARDEDNYGRARRCTCGYLAAMEEMQYHHRPSKQDYQHLHDGFPGCRGCDPIDHESKPYGWGIETFEDPALEEANEYARNETLRCYGAYSLAWGRSGCYSNKLIRDARWKAYSKHNHELERISDAVWGALCDCCESHREAVRRYEQWCGRRGLKRKAK